MQQLQITIQHKKKTMTRSIFRICMKSIKVLIWREFSIIWKKRLIKIINNLKNCPKVKISFIKKFIRISMCHNSKIKIFCRFNNKL